MRISKTLLLLPLFLFFAVTVYGQPWYIEFTETGSSLWALDGAMDSVCAGTGHRIADGTVIKIYHDVDNDGPDATDPLMTVCDDPPNCTLQEPERSVNYNEFVFNGVEGIGDTSFLGYFTTSGSPNVGNLLCIGNPPSPNKLYLRILLPSDSTFYESPVYTPVSGPQSIECSWTCFNDSIMGGGGCDDPRAPTNFTATDGTLCTGSQLLWSHPDTTELDSFRIYRGGVLIGRTVNTVTSYLDSNAPTGQPLVYSVKAWVDCGGGLFGLSPAATDTGSIYPSPVVPDSIFAKDDTCNAVRVTWRFTSGSGTDSFTVKRNGVAVGGLRVIGTPGLRTVYHQTTDPSRGGYRVVGWSSVCGEGTPSAVDSGNALQPPTAIPDSVRASDGLCGSTYIYCRAITGVTGYRGFRYSITGTDSTYIGQVATLPIIDTGGANGTVYRYRVCAVNACGNGPLSAEFDNGYRVSMPLQVASVNATDATSCDTVTVTWANAAQEVGYKIIRQRVAGGTIDTFQLAFVDSLKYFDLTAEPDTLYNYRVLAYNACGNGPVSTSNQGQRKAAPTQVQNVGASDSLYCWGVRITWNDVSNEDSFLVSRDGSPLRWRPVNTLSYNDSTAVVGQVYSYSVRAKNNCGEGLESVANTGSRRGKPSQVLGVNATDNSCTNIVIVWNNVAGEDNFQILKDNVLLATNAANDTDYIDTSSPPGTYAYRILAYNTCGTADTSAADSGRRLSPPPVVATVTATDTVCAHVLVQWTNVAGEDSFQIRRNGTRLDVVATDVLSYYDVNAVPGTRYKYTVASYNICGAAEPTATDSGGRRNIPAALSTLNASRNNCDSVLINWSATANTDSFWLSRGSDFTIRLPASTLSWTDNTATAGVDYSYNVQPRNSCGFGTGGIVVGKRLVFPTIPQNLAATSTLCDRIRLTWTASTGDVDHYVLWRDSSPDSFIVHKDSTGYDDSTSTFGTHNYTLKAVSDQCGPTVWCTGASGFRVQQAGIPGSVLATGQRCDSVVITWTAATGDVDGYIIYENATPLDTVGSDTLYYAYQPAVGGGFSYTVRALSNECGLGAVSNSDSGGRLAAPTAASGLTATTELCYGVELAWFAGTGSITGYIVRRDSVELDTLDVLSYVDSAGNAGSAYYDVISYSQYCGDAEPSAGVTGTRLPAPVSPDTVTATTNLCDSVIVEWNAGSGTFDGYKLYRNAALHGIFPTTVRRFAEAPQSGQTYRYTVSAFDTVCGEADTTAWALGTRLSDASVPLNLVASDSCDYVFCDWDASTGAAAGYILYRNDAFLDTILAPATDYADTSAERGVTYEYAVSAYSTGCGETDVSIPDSGMRLPLPVQVTMISGSFDVCSGIYIRWNAVVGTEWYIVYRDSVLIDSVYGLYTNFLDTNVVPRATHYYQVASKNICGVGAPSDTVSGTRKDVPDAVTGFFASDSSCAAIYLIWSDVATETEYVIYRDGSPIDSISSGQVTYRDSIATPGAHTYVVYAKNGCGLSTISETANAYRIQGVDQVTDLTATRGLCYRVDLTWVDLTNEWGYYVYRDGIVIDTLDPNIITYADSPAPGTYEYTIAGYNVCGTGPVSTTAEGYRAWVPAQVMDVTATQDSCTSVTLTWTDVATEQYYLIYRTDAFIDTVDSNITSFVDQPVAPDSYIYQVRAGNYCGLGLASTGIIGRVPNVPGVVTGLTASDTSCHAIYLQWNDLSDETYYRIFFDNSLLDSTTQNDTTWFTIPYVGQHQFAIQAVNACGIGDTSVWVTGERQGTPTGISVITVPDSTCDTVHISWTPLADITRYYLYRDGQQFGSITPQHTSWLDWGLTPGYHRYQVQGYNECGTGPISLEDSILVEPTVGAITGLAATLQSCSTVSVTWNNVDNETGYRVYRDALLLATLGANVVQYVDTPAVGTYYYKVQAFNTCGTRIDSVQGRRRGAPLATTITASDNSCDNIVLTWPGVEDELGYIIYQGPDSLTRVGRDTLTLTLTPPPGAYGYRIQPYNDCGRAAISVVDSGHRLTVPDPVVITSVTTDRCDGIIIQWGNVLTETRYVIFRGADSIGFRPADSLRFTDVPPIPGEYWYRVRADNACGSAALSDSVRGERLSFPLPPTNVTASDTLCGMIVLRWMLGAGDVDRLIIYRDGVAIDTISSGDLSYTDDTTGTHSYNIVPLSNECGPGQGSASDNGRGYRAPNTPTALDFTEPANCDSVMLTWTVSTGDVEKYLISRDGILIDSTLNVFYHDRNVTNADTHLYAVRAKNSYCAPSGLSNTANGWLLPLTDTIMDLPDTLVARDSTYTVVFEHCLPVDWDSIYVSFDDSAFVGLAGFSPVENTITFTLPWRPRDYTPDCRVRVVSARGARRDTIEAGYFVIYCNLSVDDESSLIPKEFFLDQNYPNPFNPSTNIRFGVPRASVVTIEVFDILGRVAATLTDGRLQPGIHNVIWDCSGCPSGMYIIRMKTDDRVFLRKMLLMK